MDFSFSRGSICLCINTVHLGSEVYANFSLRSFKKEIGAEVKQVIIFDWIVSMVKRFLDLLILKLMVM